METTLDLSADTIDIRDIIARVEELEADRDSQTRTDDDGTEHEDPQLWRDQNQSDAEELDGLTAILDDLRGNGGDEQWRGDWYPVTLIRDSYFETAMDELLEDIGELPKDLPSYLTIAVDYGALEQDYSTTEIEGTDYLYR